MEDRGSVIQTHVAEFPGEEARAWSLTILAVSSLSCLLVGKEMRGRGTRQTGAALEGRGEVPGTDEEDLVQDSAQSESL